MESAVVYPIINEPCTFDRGHCLKRVWWFLQCTQCCRVYQTHQLDRDKAATATCSWVQPAARLSTYPRELPRQICTHACVWPHRPARAHAVLTEAHSALTATSRCPLAGQAIPIPLLFDTFFSPPLVPPLKIPQYLSRHPKRFFPASHSAPPSPRAACDVLQRACSHTHLCHGAEGSPGMPLGAEGAGGYPGSPTCPCASVVLCVAGDDPFITQTTTPFPTGTSFCISLHKTIKSNAAHLWFLPGKTDKYL